MNTHPIITLTTDFGIDDIYVGVMKGVILSINPACAIVDITHAVAPQDIAAGALALESACPYFPAGAIHVAVVDPGVGAAGVLSWQKQKGACLWGRITAFSALPCQPPA